MDKDIKAKWLTALRSGEFKQGNGKLKDGDEFCCLGVLCSALGAEFGEFFDEDRHFEFVPVMGGQVISDVENTELSASFKEQIGISGYEEQELINKNDLDCLSFNEIADYIEKEL